MTTIGMRLDTNEFYIIVIQYAEKATDNDAFIIVTTKTEAFRWLAIELERLDAQWVKRWDLYKVELDMTDRIFFEYESIPDREFAIWLINEWKKSDSSTTS